ncbi:hypothetical protein [Xenorhabdus szentirmaii]|uniref:hypothetical protein n=1 Tax=Xenorhabdus szentirmaii TaxID=290112 RepID=UPI0019C84F3B|nr:hypothetical protein [Xenorhabdus sp. 38]MBD2780840.1 hypothetical protein [Xenorhabdus sp. 38]
MDSVLAEYIEDYNASVFEEAITSTLISLPWESESLTVLRDKVIEIAQSYDGFQADIEAVCIFWLLSDQHIYEEKTRYQTDTRTLHRMEVVARLIINKTLKKVSHQMPPAQKH